MSSTAASIATKLDLSGGKMLGAIDMNQNKIINLPKPTEENDAVNMEFLDLKIDDLNKKITKNTIATTSHPKDEFRYLMEDVDESSSETNIVVTGIVDFQQSPHKINKKAYALKINKRSSDNMFLGRIGFNMFRIPEGEYTICVEFFSWENGWSECECSFSFFECESAGDESFCKLFQIDHSHAQMAHFSSRVSHVGFEMAGQS